jgi:hypothetical protein
VLFTNACNHTQSITANTGTGPGSSVDPGPVPSRAHFLLAATPFTGWYFRRFRLSPWKTHFGLQQAVVQYTILIIFLFNSLRFNGFLG